MTGMRWQYCPSCGAELLDEDDPAEPLTAQVCAACGFVRYANPVPVAAALVETSNGIVLVHDRRWPFGIFGLVTGFVEAGEHPADAARREVKEELGLDGKLDHLIGLYPMVETNQLIVAYAMTAEGEVALGDELDDMRIVPRDKLRAWTFGTGLAVRDWLALHGSTPVHRHPIMDALEVLGRRWTLRILWELSERGPLGFRALREACGGLSPDTLSTRLKDLDAVGLVMNDEHAQNGTSVNRWGLTERARALKPYLLGIAQWARERQ